MKKKSRKRYSPKLKFQVVLEALRGEREVGQIARAYGIHPITIHHWKKKFLEDGQELFSKDTTVKQYEKKIAELERLLGQKEVEIAMYKNFFGSSA